MKNRTSDTKDGLRVIHPLADQAEEKVNVNSLGLMPMTRNVKWLLITLRTYLIVMISLVFIKVFTLAGF